MKEIERVCIGCGDILITRGTAIQCTKCFNNKRATAKAASEKTILENLGYVNIKEPTLNKFSQRVWTFTHTNCGVEQSWTYGNLQTRIKKDPTNIPCSKCGSERRITNANS